jgi:predicted MFS family arabinose efflux permease
MSQQEIYALRDDARSRINTVFMGTTFVGGAVSSAVAGGLHDVYGWTGVCWFGAVLPLVGLSIWAVTLRPSRAPELADMPA